MKRFNAADAARGAVTVHVDRPATAIVHDSAEARLVVFRLMPGHVVKAHRSPSSVTITVIEGSGMLTGEGAHGEIEEPCAQGDVAVFAPKELHGMRALDETLLLLATITPRPGGA